MPLNLRLLLAAVCTCFAFYAAALVWSSSFTVEGMRWYALFDDAMISMRYARHLAGGEGLVWNPGERVEGFTNPGWTFIMALVHLVENRESWTSLYVQVISALCLVGTILLTARLALLVAPGRVVVAGVAAVAMAFYFPLNYFSLMGMEAGILALMLTAAACLLIRAGDAGRASVAAWLLMALAVFVRLDAVVPALALAIMCAVVYPGVRRKNLVIAAAALAVSLAVQTAGRLYYYGEPLPNTYYLKMSEVPLLARVGRGLWVASRFTFNHLWPFYVLVPFVVIRCMRNRAACRAGAINFLRSPAALLLAVVLGQLAYSTYVGGDVWEWFLYANRFLVIAAPMIFILLALLVVGLLERWQFARQSLGRHPTAWTLFLGLLMVLFSNWHGGYELARDQALLRRPLYGVSDAKAFVVYAQQVKKQHATDTTIAIDRAGTLPYFLHDYGFFDILGKADPVIARMQSNSITDPGTLIGNHFVPGHTKWSAAHTIGQLNPDIVILTVDFMNDDYMPWLQQQYELEPVPGLVGRVYQRVANPR